MDFYEHLLYNRTLDLIQDFKNIKQNYYKSRGISAAFLPESCLSQRSFFAIVWD